MNSQDLKILTQKGAKVIDRGNNKNTIRGLNCLLQDYKPKKRGMNGVEKRYAQLLELKKKAGEIYDWKYEPLKLRLANGVYYKCDFMVITEIWGDDNDINKNALVIEWHETKGNFLRRSGINSFKVARETFPYWKFRMMQWTGEQWREIHQD